MSIEEIKEILKRESMQEAVLIGSKENRENYYPAIIKCDEEKGVVTYDYELLAECFANEFLDRSKGATATAYEQAMTDAYEWIDYNVIRALPYWGEHAPIVYEKEED